jgi:CLIP-associating protein 1/2
MLNQLLRIAGYTKKIMANQSQQAVTAIIQNTSCQPRATLTLLWQTIQEKTPAARGFAVGHIKVFLETHGQSSRQLIEASGHLETLEKCIYKGLVDPSPIVKEPSRHCFWSFHTIWPERGKAVLAKLDPVGRKQLEKLSPDPSALAGVPQVTTESKKPSVAAAIAANRAKAKQIAAAPPTLRHQATSTAHNTPRGPSSGIPPRERRTPSTTMLPPSPEASPRATPSPPLSASASKFRLDSRSPPPAQMRRVPKSPSPPAPIQRPRVASRGGLVSTPKIQRKAPLASTPSAKSDAAQSTAPSSPLSQASDSLADQSFNLLSFASPVIPPTTSRPPLSVNPVQEPDPAIEEELRATSAQAEAAAQQLLDISRSPQIAKRSLLPEPSSLPETPVKNPEVKKRLDTFQNSPFSVREPSQLALLTDRPQLSWWFKIKKSELISYCPPIILTIV